MARPVAGSVVAGLLLAAAVAPGAWAADATDGAASVPGVDPLTLDDLGGAPTRELLDRAVTRFDPGVARTFELDGAVQSFEYVEVVEEEVVVTLETDVLFDVGSAELSDAAVERVREVAADLPEGVTAGVAGHTDSVGEDAANQDLSQRRAQAVADVAAAERPDVSFDVTGFGESRLKVAESGEDVADARAQNRRVELRYSGTAPGASMLERQEEDLAPVTVPYEPAEGPRVEPVEDAEVVTREVVDVPLPEGGEARVRVGVEPIVVRGSVMRLRLQLTPLDPVDGDSDRLTVYELTGGELHPRAVDPYALVSYEPVESRGLELQSDPFGARTAVGGTVRYEVYLPRPLDESLSSLYVSVVPTWPTFEDVPVRWE
ncbi:OmpA family protein [Cellulosimicrobium marinum]|uniref:OmpA family protein n=1 Tax=Cellulosimicrobium marinum TaxID=1638992 RepID=UPI001E37F52F|nr:OmpA family protein [Cellulosimicrobium marinum]MCB7135085.1 OmpA family protein [Cellulosimicrobium marinum]